MSDRAIAADRQLDMLPVDADVLVPTDGSADQYDPAVRERLDDILRRVRIAQEKHIRSGLEIGSLLLAAKRSLKHGMFMRWVTKDVGISTSTASNYMRAAELVDDFPNFGTLPPSSLYTLAKAPRPVIEAVAAEVKSGGTLTHRDVVERCRAAKNASTRPLARATVTEGDSKPAATGSVEILEDLQRLVARIPAGERSLLQTRIQAMEPEALKSALLDALEGQAALLADTGRKVDDGVGSPSVQGAPPDNHRGEPAEEKAGGSPVSSSPTAISGGEASVQSAPMARAQTAARTRVIDDDMPELPPALQRGPDNSLPKWPP